MLKKTPFLNVIGTYNSAVMAMKGIRENPVNLVFMDIQMPDLSGLEFATILPKDTKIILTTAFSQYAIDGYKINALDYLLKPISYEEFLKSANKALDWFTNLNKQNLYSKDRFMFVKSEYKLVQIKLDDLLYIEGLKDYVRIYLDNNQKPIMSLMNMKKLEEFLPKPEFMRTHRSYIVHMTKIKLVDRLRIVFGDSYIPISESYKDTVQKYLDGYTLI
jgi:DNA-binding LytR/AlgR family response regulator